MDLLYYSETDGIQVALGTSSTAATFTFEPFSNFLISSIDDPDCQDLEPTDSIAIPNSNAFIDFDGDCLPDLFLTMANDIDTYYSVFVQRLLTETAEDGT